MSTTTATTKFAAPSAAAAQAAREHNEKLPLFRLPGELRNMIYVLVLEEGFAQATSMTAAAMLTDTREHVYIVEKAAINHLYMRGSRVECLWLASSQLRAEYREMVLERIGQSVCLGRRGREHMLLHRIFRGKDDLSRGIEIQHKRR